VTTGHDKIRVTSPGHAYEKELDLDGGSKMRLEALSKSVLDVPPHVAFLAFNTGCKHMTTLQRTTCSAGAAWLLALAGIGCEFVASVDRSGLGTTGAGGSTGLGGTAVGIGGSSGSGGADMLPDDASAAIDMGIAGNGASGAAGAGGTTVVPDDSGTTDAPTGGDAGPVCGGTVPVGWSLALYSPSSSPCPNGVAGHDLVGQATVGASACSCSCAVIQQRDCAQGTITASFAPGSGNDACVTPWLAMAVNGCTAVPPAAFDHVQAAPLAPQGTGTCAGTVQGDDTQVSRVAQLYCDVPTTSTDAVCAGTAPTGFLACIIASGNISCPSSTAFLTEFHVQDDVTLSCPPCSVCTVQTTCTNATVSIFAGGSCAPPAVGTFAANNTCVDTNPNEVTVSSMTYTATPNSMCVPGSSTGTTQPVRPRTICCQ
jgi:hypothetical protein